MVDDCVGMVTSESDMDEHWMQHALLLARRADQAGEVPVGAVVIQNGQVIGEGWNRPISANDPCAHAEILALGDAGRATGGYRLLDSTLYVTLEPCAMCAGAMIHARIDRLVYGAVDPKSGACGSVLDVTGCKALNHRIEVVGGVLGDVTGKLLKEFFASRRN